MKLTDAQVLAQLKSRRIVLKMEIERVEIAITAFEKVTDIDPLDALPFMFEEIEVNDDLVASSLLYNPTNSMEKKVLYILEKIGRGDANEITKYLLRIDPHIKNTERIFDRVTYVASRMYRLGNLDAEKVGKRNFYKLKAT
jgi:hypothetical protein